MKVALVHPEEKRDLVEWVEPSHFRTVFWYLGLAVLVTTLVIIVARNLAPPEKKIKRLDEVDCELGSDQFRRETSVLLRAPMVGGNTVELLNNGVEIFPALIEAIEGAQETICFETFIYWSGEVGMEMAEAFAKKAREGVEVRVLIDWLGSRIIGTDEENVMLDAGVELEIYRPLNWYHISRVNNRTHRKIMVVDGKLGFTGGVGIADQWKGDAHSGDKDMEWRDFHCRINGPVVTEIQAVFATNWIKAAGKPLHGERFFPKIESCGNVEMQCFHSSPTEGAEGVRLMFLYMIETAKETLDLSAAYFIPDRLMREALISAVKRGVKIRVILPGENNDVRAVTHASQQLWGDLLEVGVRIFRFRPSMYHCKAFTADRKVTSVGSANFDNRSFRLNDEMNVNIFDEDFAGKMTRIFEKDLEESSEVSLEEWRNRGIATKVRDWWYGFFRTQL